MKVIKPKQIPDIDMPLIVLSDNTSGFIEFIIKLRTKGKYNHVMWANREGIFASQGNLYSEVGMDRYMKDGHRLKFIKIAGITPTIMNLIKASINRKLKKPWYKRMYDWVGIFGQAIGIIKFNIPILDYCSEDVPQHLKNISKYLDKELQKIIKEMPNHMSPQEFNEYLKKFPKRFKLYGYWDSDIGD